MKPDSEKTINNNRSSNNASSLPGRRGQAASRDARRAEALSSALAALPLPAAQVGVLGSVGQRRGSHFPPPKKPRPVSVGGGSGVEDDEGGPWTFS